MTALMSDGLPTDYGLDALAAVLHVTATEKGFYDSLDPLDFNSHAKQLAMIHSEVTEVLEALRKDKGKEEVVEEISDILIRLLDFYAFLQDGEEYPSLDSILSKKIHVNTGRPKMHGVKG